MLHCERIEPHDIHVSSIRFLWVQLHLSHLVDMIFSFDCRWQHLWMGYLRLAMTWEHLKISCVTSLSNLKNSQRRYICFLKIFKNNEDPIPLLIFSNFWVYLLVVLVDFHQNREFTVYWSLLLHPITWGLMKIGYGPTLNQLQDCWLVMCLQDNKDLYAEEAAAQREAERRRMLSIPGLIAPSELQDEMVDNWVSLLTWILTRVTWRVDFKLSNCNKCRLGPFFPSVWSLISALPQSVFQAGLAGRARLACVISGLDWRMATCQEVEDDPGQVEIISMTLG